MMTLPFGFWTHLIFSVFMSDICSVKGKGRLKAGQMMYCTKRAEKHMGFWVIFLSVGIAHSDNLKRGSQMGLPSSQLAYFPDTHTM